MKGKKDHIQLVRPSKFCIIHDKSLCESALKIRNN